MILQGLNNELINGPTDGPTNGPTKGPTNQKPESTPLIQDRFIEELAYPCVFAGVKRDLPEDLTILKKSKSDILRLVLPILFYSCRYDRRCSTNIPLLFPSTKW